MAALQPVKKFLPGGTTGCAWQKYVVAIWNI